MQPLMPPGRHESSRVLVGGTPRARLLEQLERHGVLLNDYARMLLSEQAFSVPTVRTELLVVQRSVADLGFARGAHLSQVHAAARRQGLEPCPLIAAPYLRLTWLGQRESDAGVGASGRAPRGALTVLSPPRFGGQRPNGFYLRVSRGRAWLRGYRCEAGHRWSADDQFIFRVDSRR